MGTLVRPVLKWCWSFSPLLTLRVNSINQTGKSAHPTGRETNRDQLQQNSWVSQLLMRTVCRNMIEAIRGLAKTERRRSGLLFVLYLVLALVATRPLVMWLGSHIPYGCESEATVPLLNLWTLWWNADRAASGFQEYWTAPIFHPTRGTFAFSEAQPTMLVVAPLVWLTGNRVLAYNVYQLVILTLNGWTAERLLRRVGHRPWLACCGGVMCELLPFVWWQLGVVQLTTVFGIVWTVSALWELFQPERCLSPALNDEVRLSTRSTGWHGLNHVGVRLGGAFGLTYWMCNYWGLFLSLILIPASVTLWNGRLLRLHFWRDLFVASVIAGLMILPIASIQRSLSKSHTWQRDGSLIVSLSAHPRDLTDTPWPGFVPGLEHPEATRRDVWPLGGGGLKLLLAPIGLIAALTTRGRRRWGLFATAFGLIAFGLSLGPTYRFAEYLPWGLAGESPYEWLQRLVPGFSLIRSPFRFVLFVQLAAVWLSIETLDLLDPRRWQRAAASVDSSGLNDGAVESRPPCAAPCWSRPTLLFWLWRVPLVAASLLVTLEVVPPKQALHECRSARDLPVWVMWLRDVPPSEEPIACLPFPSGYTVRNYLETTEWMYWSTFHHHPLVNGYSGFFPQEFLEIKEGLEQFDRAGAETVNGSVQPALKLYPWNNAGLTKLNASGAEYVVVPRWFATRDEVWMHPATKFRWAWMTGDETEQIDIYQIQPLLSE